MADHINAALPHVPKLPPPAASKKRRTSKTQSEGARRSWASLAGSGGLAEGSRSQGPAIRRPVLHDRTHTPRHRVPIRLDPFAGPRRRSENERPKALETPSTGRLLEERGMRTPSMSFWGEGKTLTIFYIFILYLSLSCIYLFIW